MEVSQFDEITTAIFRSFEKSGKVQDQIMNTDPIWALMNHKGKKEIKGGREIQVNLRYGRNTTGGSYDAHEPLDTTPMNTLAHAIFNWKRYAISITVDEATVLMNTDANSIIDLVAYKTQEATDSLQEIMTEDLYGDGTGNSGKDMLGLQALISASGTLGGIDRAAYTWWQAISDTTAVAVDTGWMGTMINNIAGSGGGDAAKMGRCDLIVMPQDLYESFSSLILPYARTKGTGVGALGFTSLEFMGREITWSDNMPAGTVYFLSTEYLGLRVMPGRDFSFKPFATPVNQPDSKVAFLQWMGQMVVSNCRRLGVATNKSA